MRALTMVGRATPEEIATAAHRGQTDKSGRPYIEHVRRVVSRVQGDVDAEAVAWLHDVVEDTKLTTEHLSTYGIASHVLVAVDVLTRKPGISYADYIGHVQAVGGLAKKVKLADLEDHIQGPHKCPPELVDRYTKAMAVLSDRDDNGWIQTFSKLKFDPVTLDPAPVNILDIAHALAMQCRFTGHTSRHFSVAQHSVIVSEHVPADDALHALLHDASEAYLCDVAAPIKRRHAWSGYRGLEARLQSYIYRSFGLSTEMPKSVKVADLRMLLTEALALMGPMVPGWSVGEGVEPLPVDLLSDEMVWTPEQAKARFLQRFYSLYL